MIVDGGRWRLAAGPELDRLIAGRVFGVPAAGAVFAPAYSTDAGAMWRIVEHLATQQGYDRPRFAWDGPLFKPEQRYLTHEGYGLGTTCWYVAVEEAGERWCVAADTPMLAVCWAALELVARREQER